MSFLSVERRRFSLYGEFKTKIMIVYLCSIAHAMKGSKMKINTLIVFCLAMMTFLPHNLAFSWQDDVDAAA